MVPTYLQGMWNVESERETDTKNNTVEQRYLVWVDSGTHLLCSHSYTRRKLGTSASMMLKTARAVPFSSLPRSFALGKVSRNVFFSTSAHSSFSASFHAPSSSCSHKVLALSAVMIPILFVSSLHVESVADSPSSSPPLGSAAGTALLHDHLKRSSKKVPQSIMNRIVIRQSHYRDHVNSVWGHTSYVKIPLPTTNSLSSSIRQLLEGAGSFIQTPPSESVPSPRSLEDIEK